VDVNLISGGRHEDARGTLRFVNDFDMSEVKRFYTISNSAEQPKRGWIMHKRETKWFFPVTGVTKIEVEKEGGDGQRRSFLLNAAEPAVLQVPPNHWFLIDQSPNLQSPSPPFLSTLPSPEVQVFSNCHVGEFPNDDFRKEP